jgi:regulator of RNase E activity RraB
LPLRSETREKINRQYTYIVENIKFEEIYDGWEGYFHEAISVE